MFLKKSPNLLFELAAPDVCGFNALNIPPNVFGRIGLLAAFERFWLIALVLTPTALPFLIIADESFPLGLAIVFGVSLVGGPIGSGLNIWFCRSTVSALLATNELPLDCAYLRVATKLLGSSTLFNLSGNLPLTSSSFLSPSVLNTNTSGSVVNISTAGELSGVSG